MMQRSLHGRGINLLKDELHIIGIGERVGIIICGEYSLGGKS